MRPTKYVIEVRAVGEVLGLPESEIVVGRFWITKELVENIVSDMLLKELIGKKVVEILKHE